MASRKSPKRVRGEQFIQKVFEATAAEVVRIGHQDISIEEVAARAGVNKTSIYRRWLTPERLVVELFERSAEASYTPPDTGTVRGDITKYITNFERIRHEPIPLAIMRLSIASAFKGKLSALVEKLFERDHQDVLRIFERAIARGELPRGVSPEMGYELVRGLNLHLTLASKPGAQETVAPERVKRLIEPIVLGLANVALHAAAGRRDGGK
jgi:AcrR family transcriptional regulator